MRTFRGALAGAVLLAATAAAPAPATGYGIVVDVGSFTGAVPSGFTGSSDFPDCEFERYSSAYDHYQHIFADPNADACTSTSTTGSPGGGDVSIYQRFSALPGEYYKAWAIGRMGSPVNARAQVKIIFRNGVEAIGECYGYTESTSFQTYYAGPNTFGNNGYPAPSMSLDGGCLAPSGTQYVAVHFRIHARAAGASGKAVLSHLRFGRCYDTGICTNVPAPGGSA
jgi:hypothetical protein